MVSFPHWTKEFFILAREGLTAFAARVFSGSFIAPGTIRVAQWIQGVVLAMAGMNPIGTPHNEWLWLRRLTMGNSLRDDLSPVHQIRSEICKSSDHVV
jgi:hypothetical protein